jgi:pimeloyl-ACP methyl ester carboxylesterase
MLPRMEQPSVQDVPRAQSRDDRQLPTGALSAGAGEPLVLLHGVVGGAAMWRGVLPLLAQRHRVIALNALGHHGGTPCTQRPARIAHVVDDAERTLDLLGYDRVHLAGNSMGGWVALELARRGRARSVCALSPAGLWGEGADQQASIALLKETTKMTRLTRPILPLLARSKALRRFALRANAVHASDVTREALIELADLLLGCSVTDDLFETPEHFTLLRASCPITIAWSAHDQIFPRETYQERARALVPDAEHLTLEGVGHVPMFDDAALVAETILRAVGRASGASASAS